MISVAIFIFATKNIQMANVNALKLVALIIVE